MRASLRAGAGALMGALGGLAVIGTAKAAEIQSVVGNGAMGHMAPPSRAWVYALVVALGAAYLGAILEMERRPKWWQTTCFIASLVAIVAVIAGPLDRLAWQRVFVAYIAEQILIVMLAAPLLLLGLPDWMLRPLLMRPKIRPVARLLTRPVITFAFFTTVYATIHYPTVCNQICHARPFYGGIRAALLLAGVLLWWPLLSPLPELPRLRPPLQLLYLFLLIVPMTAVAAPVTLSHSVIYTWLEGPQPWGLTALTDQRMGGILMWVGQPVVLIIAATVVFLRWAQQEGE